MKNIEVEFRARIKNINSFRKKLEQYGAKFINSVYLYDIYFCYRGATKVEDVEMDAIGSYSLRLRTSIKENKEHITLNTKTIINHGDHHAWEEHEIKVNDFHETAQILMATEFKPFFKLEKNRYIYRLNTMGVCVEDIVDFGGAVEIEIICKPGEENDSKKKIKTFLQEMGISKEKIVPKSITNIIMKERAFAQKIIL